MAMPRESSLRIIVTGLIATHRFQGGVTWDYLNVVLGLKRLGHDVYYLEDTGGWPYHLDGAIAYDPKPTVDHLAGVMAAFGLAANWAYHFPTRPQWFGLSDRKREEVVRSADMLINVSGTLERPDRYRQAKKLVYVDTDPVFTQIKAAGSDPEFRARVNAHDVHFSFGETLGEELPDTGHLWHPTRQPVVLDEWRSTAAPRNAFTTVMNWSSYDVIRYRGRTYGQKDIEFVKFLDLPQRVSPIPLELALHKAVSWPSQEADPGRCGSAPREILRERGWRIVDPIEVCADFASYRRYIQASKGEWSVAKNAYVAGRSGWFSCRSACYLAAGRPVVVQDTGFSRALPVGEGIVSFSSLEEAEAGIREVEGNYERHAKAAREIAEAYFDSGKVLARLLAIAMNLKAAPSIPLDEHGSP
ncbi:MAG TPA: hypothetical protein VNL14_11250 [Candidatus Acidoferrales bacterium]|nr:hypothetical protein [Candidatus Acidoferrales bacterium]